MDTSVSMQKRHGVLRVLLSTGLGLFRIFLLDHLQVFFPGKEHDRNSSRDQTASADDQILGFRLQRQHGNDAAHHTGGAQAHQKQACATHPIVEQIIVFPVYLLSGSPEPPTGGGSQTPGNDGSSGRSLHIPNSGKGAVNAHGNDQKNRNHRKTDQIIPFQSGDPFRRSFEPKIGPDIDPNCLEPFFTRLFHIFDLIVFCIFSKSQALYPFKSYSFCASINQYITFLNTYQLINEFFTNFSGFHPVFRHFYLAVYRTNPLPDQCGKCS